MRHATDADHVIAVATIVGREKSIAPATLVGILWGLGHTATVVVVGGAMIVSGLVIPEHVAHLLESGVGLMLVVLGVLALKGALKREKVAFAPVDHPHRSISARPRASLAQRHAHVHAHGDHVHTHRHGHGNDGHGHADDATATAWIDRQLGRLGVYQALRPVIVGVIHGLAGSAAVALVVLGAIREPWWGVAYLVVFGLGTIAGMMLITAIIALPFALSARRLPRMNLVLRIGSGALSIAFGAWLLASSAGEAFRHLN